MKIKIILVALLLISSGLYLSGCDSPTDSKAVTVSAPSLVSPTDKSENVGVQPTLSWSGAAEVLEIDINPSFSSGYKRSHEVSGTQFTVPISDQLLQGTWYYWHAGHNASGSCYWSSMVFSFKP